MEADKDGDQGSISPTGGASSRWNPTKEQINILETLYKQGIRTPSAEQIQHITGRLKVYGHIEGKNVFYWFQNHKARQRQKQKQESMVYFNHYLHKNVPPTLAAPVFNPPGNNVVCSPYFIPPNNGVISYYPQCPKVPIPNMKRKQKGEKEKSKSVGGSNGPTGVAYQQHAFQNQPYGIMHTGDGNEETVNSSNETLALFPVHPTGVLNESPTSSFISSSDDHSHSSDHSGGSDEGYKDQQPYFDFFGRIGSRGSSY